MTSNKERNKNAYMDGKKAIASNAMVQIFVSMDGKKTYASNAVVQVFVSMDG
jgi:hypothetical protein